MFKRLITIAEVEISRSGGIVSLDINLDLPGRDLGVRDLPSRNQPADGLLSLLDESPFKNLIGRSSWIEFPRCHPLLEDWDNIISGCWLKKPQLNDATAALFAGCVLHNPLNKSATLCLVAES